jgi:signal transduction histidine kinase
MTSHDTAVKSAELSDVLRDYVQVAERLQATHEALEGEVHRLRRELKRKDRELEQRRRLAALGEVAAGVAHEVRNPLGAIQLFSGLLRQQCGGLRPAMELIEKIQAGVQSIDRVVQSTLALAPNRVCRLAPQPIRLIAERAAEMAADAFARRSVKLDRRFADAGATVVCDADALQRALLNLLANAAEASPAGGRVVLSTALGQRRSVRVRVLDQGPGLPAALKGRLFEPFFTTKETGTGLGLSIAYRLIEAHNGKLTARNVDDGGAEFTVVLTRHDPTGRQAATGGEAAGEPTAA